MVQELAMEQVSSDGRRALTAAAFGYFVDMLDVYLPVIALTPAITYFEPKSLPVTTSTTLYYLVFILSLIGRPVGSFIFGHFADRVGRRRSTVISLAGCGITTLLMAFLPGYATWGLAGIVLLAVLRFIDGIFLGGEYTSASPLAMELSPISKRGKYSGIVGLGFPGANIVISLLTLWLQTSMSSGGPETAYSVWGWRIPFAFGGLLTLGFLLYYFRKVPESELWKEERNKVEAPLKELFQGVSLKRLAQVFVLMSGIWFILNGVTSPMPAVLHILKVNGTNVTLIQLIANLVLLALCVPTGILSQKIGRKKVLAIIGVLSFTIVPWMYYVLVHSGYQSLGQTILLATLINACTIPAYSVLTAYINERFHTGVRASGYGIGFSLAVIIPSFSSFFMLDLKNWMPYQYTQIVITLIGGLLLFIGALVGPETKRVDLKKMDASSTVQLY